jgi:pimeloyl-ACP methyl ester carboxylesterase
MPDPKERMKGHDIIISIFSVMLIISSLGIMTIHFAYGKSNQVNSNTSNNTNTNSLDIQHIPTKKVRVGDIDIAYKVFGKGDPFLLISGAYTTMNTWEPSTLKGLSSSHTVIIFDNRGVGNTTTGTKPFSIQQFANDTYGLIAALKIQKADVLGFSMGSFVAQELALMHPDKVNRLVLYGASCGGKENIPQSPQIMKLAEDFVNKFANNTQADPQEVKMFLALGFGSGWMKLHPGYLESVPIPIPTLKDLFAGTTPNNGKQQLKAVQSWMATSWSGICDQLQKISSPTLIITGTDDVAVPRANSLIIAAKIPGAWVVQIKDAGHLLISQYPDKFNKVLQTFLMTTP